VFHACIELFPYPPDTEGIGLGSLKEAAVPANNVFGAVLRSPVKFCKWMTERQYLPPCVISSKKNAGKDFLGIRTTRTLRSEYNGIVMA
jgi:hypothetical protein